MVDSVKAKFFVRQNRTIANHPQGKGAQIPDAVEVELQPVYGDDGENADWSKYTPAGKIEMTITNEAAANFFETGKSYIVEFREADLPDSE